MSEDENMNVAEVVQPSEAETVQDEIQQPARGSKEYNFAEQRKLIEEQRRLLREYEERDRQRSYGPPQPEPEDELEAIGKDELVSRKQAEKLIETIATRKAQELMAQQEYATAEDRVRLKYKDYDDVVTQDNVKELIEDDLEVSETIKSSPNPYAAAYKLIKKSNFYHEKGKKKSPEAEKIVKNAQKPVSSNAVQARPLSGANNYAFASDGERDSMYKEMMEAARRR